MKFRNCSLNGVKSATFFSSEDVQLKRLQERDGIDEEAARKRIQAQYPMSAKRHRATHIVDNNGTFEETRVQVQKLIEEFNKSNLHLLVKAAGLLAFLSFLGFSYLFYSVTASSFR